jgi:integrase
MERFVGTLGVIALVGGLVYGQTIPHAREHRGPTKCLVEGKAPGIPQSGDGCRELHLQSERSRRTVSLPDFAITSLGRQRLAQEKAKFAARTKWVESGLVFTTTIGTALDERNVRREFKAILQSANLAEMRIHDLRHTAASLLLVQGVQPRVVMEILGTAKSASRWTLTRM